MAEATQGEATIVGGRYRVMPEIRLEEFDRTHIEAFAVEDMRDRTRSLIGLVARRGRPVRDEWMSAIRRIDQPGLLRTIDGGVVDPGDGQGKRYAVIMERPQGGRVMDWLRAEGQSLDDLEMSRLLLRPLAAALKAVHDVRTAHRAIAPDNLYFVDSARTRIALGDCLCGPPGESQPVAFESVERAAAHPAGRGDGGPREDFFALGALFAAALARKVPGTESPEAAADLMLRRLERGSYVALTDRARFGSDVGGLLRGLLSDNAEERWGFEEVRAWLDGRRSIGAMHSTRPQAARAFTFKGVDHSNTMSLATALAQHWREALRVVIEEKLDGWVARAIGDERRGSMIAQTISAGRTDGGAGADATLARVLAALDPEGPLRLRHVSVMKDGLGTLIAVSFLDDDRDTRQALAEMLVEGLPITSLGLVDTNDAQRRRLAQSEMAEFMRLRGFVAETIMGFGLERVLYDLNPTLPCLSPLVADAYPQTVPALLMALDQRAAKAGRGTAPVDRHIAAFIATKLGISYAGALKGVVRQDSEASERLSQLNLLSLAQETQPQVLVPALSRWLVQRLGPVVQSYGAKTTRAWMEKELERAVSTGNLNALRAIVDNPDRRMADDSGMAAARTTHAQLGMAMRRYDETRAARRAEAQHFGRQVAAMVGYTLLLSVLAALTFGSVG
ncbi:hypothetical protein GCM10011505_07440 [Tistrella bauzanensis]|uniref:Protein kinase domain-containing protein n=1 Tax=Tistrella bauzanensis TaxID=657419 RepID=A0ABQ1IA60_9PROT|nr:hypothetical protein [Tistrella bauzanensis]GGB28669.1 hypothetical protein GCM10011505_07440 [Tistrella bauzanensis]